MLVVLSEINCLKTLEGYGVHPDLFYTDVDRFMTDSVTFREADILVILAGCCAFSKRRIFDLIKHFNKRVDAEFDKGISHVYVVSDSEMPYLDAYYKYESNMDICSVMRGRHCVVKEAYIWDKLRTNERETISYLSSYDIGDGERSRQVLKEIRGSVESGSNVTDDNYIKHIKLPDLRKLLS